MKKIMEHWREFQKRRLDEKMVLRDYKKYASIVSEAYQARPVKDSQVIDSYKALIKSNNKWYKRLKSKIDVKVVDNYNKIGYKSAEDMKDRVEESGVMIIDERFAEHPVLSKKQTYIFRAVHDYIVHILGEKPFGLKGELQAYNLHAKLIPDKAKTAIFSEVVGQVSVEISTGNFPNPQKACKLFGFDYNKVGRVNWQEYQKNFSEEYGGKGKYDESEEKPISAET